MDVSETIIFSSDTGVITSEDIQACGVLSESFFNTSADPDQFQINEEKNKFIMHHLKPYLNVVRSEEKVIGFFFTYPTTRKDMYRFLEKKISEETLFQTIIPQAPLFSREALYLCATVVVPKWRGNGLSILAARRTLEKVYPDERPALFYWGYSRAGQDIARRIAGHEYELYARAV